MFICPLLHPKQLPFYAFSVSPHIGNLSLRRHPVTCQDACDLLDLPPRKNINLYSIQKSLFTPRLGKHSFSISSATAGMSSRSFILICENAPRLFLAFAFRLGQAQIIRPVVGAASQFFSCCRQAWYCKHAARCCCSLQVQILLLQDFLSGNRQNRTPSPAERFAVFSTFFSLPRKLFYRNRALFLITCSLCTVQMYKFQYIPVLCAHPSSGRSAFTAVQVISEGIHRRYCCQRNIQANPSPFAVAEPILKPVKSRDLPQPAIRSMLFKSRFLHSSSSIGSSVWNVFFLIRRIPQSKHHPVSMQPHQS